MIFILFSTSIFCSLWKGNCVVILDKYKYNLTNFSNQPPIKYKFKSEYYYFKLCSKNADSPSAIFILRCSLNNDTCHPIIIQNTISYYPLNFQNFSQGLIYSVSSVPFYDYIDKSYKIFGIKFNLHCDPSISGLNNVLIAVNKSTSESLIINGSSSSACPVMVTSLKPQSQIKKELVKEDTGATVITDSEQQSDISDNTEKEESFLTALVSSAIDDSAASLAKESQIETEFTTDEYSTNKQFSENSVITDSSVDDSQAASTPTAEDTAFITDFLTSSQSSDITDMDDISETTEDEIISATILPTDTSTPKSSMTEEIPTATASITDEIPTTTASNTDEIPTTTASVTEEIPTATAIITENPTINATLSASSSATSEIKPSSTNEFTPSEKPSNSDGNETKKPKSRFRFWILITIIIGVALFFYFVVGTIVVSIRDKSLHLPNRRFWRRCGKCCSKQEQEYTFKLISDSD